MVSVAKVPVQEERFVVGSLPRRPNFSGEVLIKENGNLGRWFLRKKIKIEKIYYYYR
ncbi:MAG: hypothetical protein LBC30_04570 [Puniceicoccales bacterium]|jgi:hypothetical protein|nr:hypothetical protein [Puniceicoccales bacterium]